MNQLELSVIVPVLNEESHIENIIGFFLRSLPEAKELLLVDGGSTDRTREIAGAYASRYPDKVFLIENPRKYVPFALNAGIARARGTVICCLSGHSRYADDYFERVLETFATTDADIVGGPWRSEGTNPLQSAIAAGISSRFGTGGSIVRDENYRGYSDHVIFGAWKREIFHDVGLFDETLIRNQDEEFHYRAKSKGKKLYLNPDIRLYYHPRSSISKLFSQYFQYGVFKPKVTLMQQSGIHLRHLIPAFFVIYVVLSLFFSVRFPAGLVPLVLYMMLIIVYSLKLGKGWRERMYLLAVFPVLHVSYGLGYLRGIPAAVLHRPPKPKF